MGSPNVGKSLLFYHLTGKYATVSNYPGTSVDVMKGKIKGVDGTLIDTPGMYSLMTITEEERIAKRILLEDSPDVVVHVIDAKNLERKLPLTLQLIDACFNTILVLNAMDEAERLGIEIDAKLLENKLGIPVITTVATQKKGIRKLKDTIIGANKNNEKKRLLKFSYDIEKAVEYVNSLLKLEYPIDKRFIAQLIIMGDKDAFNMIKKRNEESLDEIIHYTKQLSENYSHSLSYEMAKQTERVSSNLLHGVINQKTPEKGSIIEKLNELTIHPVFAIPMAIGAISLLYFFAGIIGAQILVEILENFFENNINSPLNNALDTYVPYPWLRDLIGGDFGIVTLGLRYSVAIILPIVSIFFFLFSIIEDSGYLPRLAILMDRLFKIVGLSGKAVIPLVLGLGCGTMATIVTRVLETRKEKVISTLMLAVGIPCSAQLGVILSVAPDFIALFTWMLIIGTVLMIVGYFASKLVKGEESLFMIEIPTLRIPDIGNVATKTLTRLEWYFKEVIPVFIIASIFIWTGRLTGIFDLLINSIVPLARLLGLPDETAIIFLFGFFRRDYGAAGLFDLSNKGILSYPQVIVAMVTLTLFVPCVAQFLVMIKERGIRAGILIFLLAIVIAFGVGYLTNLGFIIAQEMR